MCLKKQEDETSIARLLGKIDFFTGLGEADLARFVRISTIQHFQHEETIVLAGDARRAIFFIVNGQAKIFYDAENSRNCILSLFGSGDFFGEVQLFNKSAKTLFSAKAEGECSVIIFKGEDFIKEITSNSKLSFAFLRKITQKLNKTYMQIATLSMSTIKGRIKASIMQFVDEMGVKVMRNGTSVTMLKNRPTQMQIAEMSGTSRETVNREFSRLLKNGYIELDNKCLYLLKELS